MYTAELFNHVGHRKPPHVVLRVTVTADFLLVEQTRRRTQQNSVTFGALICISTVVISGYFLWYWYTNHPFTDRARSWATASTFCHADWAFLSLPSAPKFPIPSRFSSEEDDSRFVKVSSRSSHSQKNLDTKWRASVDGYDRLEMRAGEGGWVGQLVTNY